MLIRYGLHRLSITRRELIVASVIFFTVLLMIPTNLFAAIWYVRPAGGDYGREDGTNYDNAWDGLLNVLWDDDGVKPGDTLYVCGLHVHEMTTRSWLITQADINLAGGTGKETRVTIRGDYPGDPGIVWGSYKMSYEPWVDEGNKVWSITLPGNAFSDWYFEDIARTSFVVLDKVTSLEECQNNSGSHYSETYGHSTKLYVHCSDSGNPTGRIYGPRWGYDFKLGANQYITFLNLTLFNPARIEPIGPRASHIRWEGCTLAYGEHAILDFYDGMHYIEVINCELSWASNGIYNISVTNDAPSHYRYIGNHIHDIGVRESNRNRDAHAIGIQGGVNGLIEGNKIERCGSGPLLFAFTDQRLQNTIVRKNFIRDIHQIGGASGYGISTQCMNDSLSDKSGNVFYYNIVINTPIAYRFQFEYQQKFFNNVAYNCDIGLQTTRNFNGKGAQLYARNNIFIYCNNYYIDLHTTATDSVFDFDHNIYYPATGEAFFDAGEYANGKYTKSYSEWQALSKPGSTFDPNSLIVDPYFTNDSGAFSIPSDFTLKPSSPAINAGISVGLSTDFAGNLIVDTPDIGAFEFPFSENAPETPTNLLIF